MENDYGTEFVATKEGGATDGLMDWQRRLSLRRPCQCGCDRRELKHGVGYITGGSGAAVVSVWIEHEDVYKALQGIFWAHGLKADV